MASETPLQPRMTMRGKLALLGIECAMVIASLGFTSLSNSLAKRCVHELLLKECWRCPRS